MRHQIAVLPGDGIGPEVVPVGLAVLRRAGELTGSFEIEDTVFPWSCRYYLERHEMMPADGLTRLAQYPAIYFGAVGFPGVPDHVSLWGLLLPIRQRFDQYVNLRPMRVLKGIPSPLRAGSPATVDMLCVRENTEGEYSGVGGRHRVGTPEELAIESSVFTRRGVERVSRYAFERARERKHRLVSVTKSNAQQYTSVLWDDVVRDVAKEYPDVEVTSYLVDALAARMVYAPETIDVMVASNLFGDILTDLGGALQGSLGLAASANIDPSRRFPSLFEPVHGSAPTIAGQGIANPLATVWAGSMMLEHLGEKEAARLVMRAVERVAEHGPHTADIGGTASTKQVEAALLKALSG